MISGIKKISVFDPATGTTVQLNNIVPEGLAQIKKPIIIKNVDGELTPDGDDSYFEFSAYDPEGYDQLKDWMDAGTDVQCVAAGVEQNLLWYESVPLIVEKRYGFSAGGRNIFTVKLAKKRGIHNILLLANLIRSGGRWEDDDSDGEADLFTSKTGTADYTFDGINFLQAIDSVSVSTTNTLFVFPISNANIYAKLNWNAGEPSGYGLEIEAYSFVGSLLGFAGTQDADNVINLLTPAGTYKLKLKITINSGVLIEFSLPFIGMKRNTYLDINH